jgi:hypothetical protein
VLPRLRGSGLAGVPEAADWPCLVFTPSRAPLDELAVAVASVAGVDAAGVRISLDADPAGFALTARQAAETAAGSRVTRSGAEGLPRQRRLLLVVDQFEQLFTQCPDGGAAPSIPLRAGRGRKLSARTRTRSSCGPVRACRL